MNLPPTLPDNAGYKGLIESWNNELIPALEAFAEGMEELERRVELMSTALKSTLTSGPTEAPQTSSQLHHVATTSQGWRPHGTGDRYWLDPSNMLKRRDEVPAEVLEQFPTPQPRAEELPEE